MAQKDNIEEAGQAKEARDSDLRWVEEWLERQGLPEHTDVFRKAKIGRKALPKVTEADLEHMKIPLGHRIELLEEIRKIESGQPSVRPQLYDDPVPGKPRSRDERG